MLDEAQLRKLKAQVAFSVPSPLGATPRSQVLHVKVHVRRSQLTRRLRAAAGSRPSTFPAIHDRPRHCNRCSGRSGTQRSALHSHRSPCRRHCPICPRTAASTASTAGSLSNLRHLRVTDSGFGIDRGRRAPSLGGGGEALRGARGGGASLREDAVFISPWQTQATGG